MSPTVKALGRWAKPSLIIMHSCNRPTGTIAYYGQLVNRPYAVSCNRTDKGALMCNTWKYKIYKSQADIIIDRQTAA